MRTTVPSATLISITDQAERHIERCGRICYKSENGINTDSYISFIRKIIACGHESVLEHASATFHLVTDRGISHEIVRSRIGVSYSQESTRYCCYDKEKFGSEITVVEPVQLAGDAEAVSVWDGAAREAELAYFDLLERGVSPQNARSVLPTCLKTEIMMTANFRAWRHFLKMRISKKAHPDIIYLSRLILKELKIYAPIVFEDIV
jgi:thymidylate synthase (FAD)